MGPNSATDHIQSIGMNKSKGKQVASKEREMHQSREERMVERDSCLVCGSSQFDNQAMEKMKCRDCHKIVHKFCYCPESREKGRFKCDECKKRSSSKAKDLRFSCSSCNTQRGILKEIGGSNQWMHVLCALTSARTSLTSYRSLTFRGQNIGKRKQKHRCIDCGSDRYPVLSCRISECESFTHLNCLVHKKEQSMAEEDQDYPSFLTIGMLDKNESSLLSHMEPDPEIFKGFKLIETEGRNISYFVCSKHNSTDFFIECPCNQNSEEELRECERCKRWMHTNSHCFGNDSAICRGCKHSDIYAKNLSLPELLHRAYQVEQVTSFDKGTVKFLDHFSLKWSDVIHKAVIDKKNVFEIERYFLRKQLEGLDEEKPDQDEETSILQILYYLMKRQIKRKQDITPKDIESLLNELKNSSKFLHNDKSEKVEKRFRPYLETLLLQINTDENKDLKQALSSVEEVCLNRSFEDRAISKRVKHLTTVLTEQENGTQLVNQFMDTDEENLIKFFFEAAVTQDQIQQILRHLRQAIRTKTYKSITEEEYAQLSSCPCDLPEKRQKQVRRMLTSILQGVKVQKKYEEKMDLYSTLSEQFEKADDGQERRGIREDFIKHNLMVPNNSCVANYEMDCIELEILKTQHFKKYSNPTMSQLPAIIRSLTNILTVNKRVSQLEPQLVQEFTQTKTLYTFFMRMNDFNKEMNRPISSEDLNLEQEEMLDSSERKQMMKEAEQMDEQNPQPKSSHSPQLREESPLKTSIYELLSGWEFIEDQGSQFVIDQLCLLAEAKIDLEESIQSLLSPLAEECLFGITVGLKDGISIKSQELAKACKVAQYFKFDNASTAQLVQLYEDYLQWCRAFEQGFSDFPELLEDPVKVQRLLQVLDSSVAENQNLKVDVRTELNKLRLLQSWGLLSQKLLKKHRATITAIQQAKNLMDRVAYPPNRLRSEVERLEKESRMLNKRISRFLEKPKAAELEPYEQLRLMTSKMVLTEGQQLKRDLENSELDVEVELSELLEEIKEFKQFPREMSDFLSKEPSLEDMLSLKRKLLDNSFQYPPEQYCLLSQCIYETKCRHYEPSGSTSKAQYFRLLQLGGTAGAQLYSDTMMLAKAYKDVAVAVEEATNIKPKSQLLLPQDGKKLLAVLKVNPTERNRVEKWYQTLEKNRDRLRFGRANRWQLDKFALIQVELSRLPINCRDLLAEVTRLRREVEELTIRAKTVLGENGSDTSTTMFSSPYCTDILMKYRSLGVRSQYLDRFEFIISKNKEIMQLKNFISVQNYKQFSICCEQAAQLVKNNEIYRIREEAFEKMFHIYSESEEVLTEIGNTLIQEGSALCRYPNKASTILEKLMKINEKFNQCHGQARRMPASSSSEEEVGVQDEEDYDYDDDEDDEIDSRSGKRPRPDGDDPVEISD